LLAEGGFHVPIISIHGADGELRRREKPARRRRPGPFGEVGRPRIDSLARPHQTPPVPSLGRWRACQWVENIFSKSGSAPGSPCDDRRVVAENLCDGALSSPTQRVPLSCLYLFSGQRFTPDTDGFGELAPEFVEQLYVDKRYKVIVEHPNFNPRLIAFITDSHKVAGVPAEQYWDYVEAMLKNPHDVWQGFFEDQLDAMGRIIVTLVAFQGGEIAEPHLRAALERARLQEVPPPSPSEWALAFERSYRMSVGAIITRNVGRAGKDPVVGLFNPSVGDFIFRKYAADVPSLERFLVLLDDHRALVRFNRLHLNRIVSDADYRAVLQRLTARFWNDPTGNPVFCAVLAELVVEVPNLVGALAAEIRTFANNFFAVMRASRDVASLIPFSQFALEENLIPADEPAWSEFVRQAMEGVVDDEVLVQLSQVVELLATRPHDEVAPEFTQHVIELWKDKIGDEVNRNSIASDYTDYETEYDKAHEAIASFVRGSLEDYAIIFDRAEIAEIVKQVDVEELLIQNCVSGEDDEAHHSYGGRASSGNDGAQIDDLFERDV
jgi:hypothetical protein